jgi:hypothetical protein
MSLLQKVQKGKPLRPAATTWNSFVDAAKWVEGQRQGRGRGAPKPNWLRPVLCRVTGPANGAGKYYGRIQFGPSLASADTDLTEDDLGDFPDFDNALLLNMQELDSAASSAGLELTDETNHVQYFTGLIIGATTDTPPLSIVAGNFIDFGCDGEES